MTVDINFRGVRLSVEYSYQPSEPMTLEYPGADESVEVDSARTLHGDDVLGLMEDMTEELEAVVLEAHRTEYECEFADHKDSLELVAV